MLTQNMGYALLARPPNDVLDDLYRQWMTRSIDQKTVLHDQAALSDLHTHRRVVAAGSRSHVEVHKVSPANLTAYLRGNAVHDTIGAAMTLDDYKVVLYRNQPSGWVAEVPAIEGCYALMPTREAALAELGDVFTMIAAEYEEKGLPLPSDTTEIVHA